MKYVTFIVLVLVSSSVQGQELIDDPLTLEYRQAHDLLFEVKSRANRAVEILLQDGKRKAEDLNPKELLLLCLAYNQAAKLDEQLKTAKVLFEKYPERLSSSLCIQDSMLSQLGNLVTTDAIIEFVDSSLSKKKGSARVLMLLKARAIVLQDSQVTNADKVKQVGELLVEAARQPKEKYDSTNRLRADPEYLVESDSVFSRFFSRDEKNAIKERISVIQKTSD